MSLGYAEKLSFRADVGTVGMPELFDSPSVLETKVTELANLIKESRHLVVFTGAGISTSCGIPDFRGPKGIWTLQRDGKPMPKTDMPFHQARPGLTHMALVELHQAGILKFIVSQNIDGLHLRSGIPREMLAELHGNSFRESCPSCGKEYIRDFEVETIGLKPTGRRCMVSSCKAKLVDTIVDWEDALPSKDLRLAEKNCKKADVVLCLGTSLQITPACNLPLKAVRAGGKLVIVNLQATPKDKNASLLIRGLVDVVVAGVMKNLHLSVPPYVRIDKISVGCAFAWTRKESVVWKLRVTSTHGQRAPLPFVRSVEVSFPDRPEMKCMMLTEQPFIIRRETMRLKSVNALIKLHFAEGSMCKSADVLHCLQFEEPEEEEETQNTDKAVEMLRLQATKDSSCGQVARMDAIDLPRGNGLAVQYAVVTGILRHSLDEVKQAADLQAAAETQKATAESPVTERKRFAEDSEEKNSAENKRTRTSQRRVSGRKRKSTS